MATKPTPEIRSHVLSFRVTPAQFKRLEAIAKSRGYPWTPSTVALKCVGDMMRASRAGVGASK